MLVPGAVHITDTHSGHNIMIDNAAVVIQVDIRTGSAPDQQFDGRRQPADSVGMSNTKTVAYHEAGHAVVARVLGLPVIHVTIFPDLRGALRQSAAWLARDDADPSVRVGVIENDVKMLSDVSPLDD